MTASRSSPASADVDEGLRLHLGGSGGDLGELAEVIEHAAHLLPQQGPITVFIHHNTLHAFEDLPFHEAIRKGGQVFGCQPYLNEDRYRDELRRGRIRYSELQEVVEEDLGERAGEPVPGFGTRIDLRLAMLQYPLRIGPTEELVWYVAEQDALRRVRPEASSAIRARLIAETRRWVMRDLRGGRESHANGVAGRPGDRRAGEGLERAARPVRRIGDRDAGATTTGSGSRSRRCGASAATACATCRRSRRNRSRRCGTATCCWRPPARTPTPW